MEVFFVTALYGLEIKGQLGRGDRLRDNDFITNERKPYVHRLDEPFRQAAGGLELDWLLQSPAVIYGETDLPDAADVKTHLLDRMGDLASFLVALWLVKDNAVHYELVFARYDRERVPYTDSKSSPGGVTNASGGRTTTVFTREELSEARRLMRTSFKPFDHVGEGSAFATEDAGRWARALYFTQAARATQDLGLKVANYCSALEALFATSSVELTHILAERVASFLEDSPAARAERYQIIKRAYSFRSSVVHGAALKPAKAKTLRETSVVLDQTLREIYLGCIAETHKRAMVTLPDDVLDRAFIWRVFGASWEELGERVLEDIRRS